MCHNILYIHTERVFGDLQTLSYSFDESAKALRFIQQNISLPSLNFYKICMVGVKNHSELYHIINP